jgi:arylsulfatase A-like enzyme
MLKNLIMKYKYSWILILVFLSSCSGFRTFDHKNAIKIQINTAQQVVMGSDSWEGPMDCSSNAYLNKTPGGLLFTIEVFDDSIKTGQPQSYMNDGIELYFDLRPPRLRLKNSYEKGVFQAVILPEPGKKQIAPIEWFPKSYKTSIPGTMAYTELRDSGYVVQVSIPYSGLRRNHFWPRNNFYLDVAINDADTGARESQLMWKGENDNWNKPHNFEAVFFEVEEEKSVEDPNILFIFTDQQTLKAMSGYGNPYLRTPNMDALARFGVKFTESYCTSPMSSPARSSLLTGMMPHETGVNYNEQAIDSTIKTMGEYFSEAGYQTIWGGKWHLPESYPQPTKREVRGFRLLPFLEGKQISDLGSLTDGPMTDEVVKFIKGRNKEPFLLAVSLHNPHDITAVPANLDSYVPPVIMEAAPPLPFNFNISSNEPELLKDIRNRDSYGNEISLTKNFSEEDWRNYLFQYYRLTEKADLQIGKIISALEQRGMDENTIIIFTSGHGEGGASHKWASALSLYEESLKVPFIICRFDHEAKPVENSTHLVSGLDILPTMMDYAGIELPEGIRGKSLKPVIENPDTIIRKYIVSEMAIDPSDSTKTGRMIRDEEYKYMIYSYGRNNEQLFNLKNDPGEMRNLAYNSNYNFHKYRLRKALEEWISETNDPFKLK